MKINPHLQNTAVASVNPPRSDHGHGLLHAALKLDTQFGGALRGAGGFGEAKEEKEQ